MPVIVRIGAYQAIGLLFTLAAQYVWNLPLPQGAKVITILLIADITLVSLVAGYVLRAAETWSPDQDYTTTRAPRRAASTKEAVLIPTTIVGGSVMALFALIVTIVTAMGVSIF